MDKFKLVLFGSDWDVYQTAFKDLIDNPRITYIPTFRPEGWLGMLQRIQFNPRLNSIANIPGKHLWNPYYLREIHAQKICFLILENWLRLECGIKLLPYLRRTYPDARIVCFMQDLADTIVDHYSHRPVNLEYVRKYADLLISYDTADAQKHRMQYHPTVFSPVNLLGDAPLPPPCDLYFLGRDKGRLHLLVKICEEARQRGLNAKFILLGVPQKQRIECDGIIYQDRPVPYMENLRNVASSNCVVEMLQQGAHSPTYRTWEAIALNKKLLTTNGSIRQSAIYDDQYISIFQDIEDVNWSFITRKCPVYDGQNPYLETIKPASLITFIEEQLTIQIDK